MAGFDELKMRRQGSIIFGPITVPANMKRIDFITKIDAAEAIKTTLSIFLRMEISQDGVTWIKWGGFGWQGHSDNVTSPSCSMASPPAGVQARLVLDVPQEINIGVKVNWRTLKSGEVAS